MKYDLGKKCECGSDECDKVYYPTIAINDIEIETEDNECVANVVLRKKYESCSYEGEEEKCSYTFEVLSLEIPSGKKKKESSDDLEESIKEAVKKVMKS